MFFLVRERFFTLISSFLSCDNMSATNNTINVMSQTLEIRLDSGERMVAMLMMYVDYPITADNYNDVLAKFRDSLGVLKNEIDKLIEKINNLLSQETTSEATGSTESA